MIDGAAFPLDPTDRARIEALLEPGEQLLHAAAAEATMRRGGIVAFAFAVPAFAVGWLPLRKALAHLGALGGTPHDRLPLLLFGGFGLLWIIVALRLLWEPARRGRLYPHVLHVLTDRRFLAIDRRSGPLHELALTDIWQMKIFSPFGRLTFWRRGLAGGTGKRARVRNFDGVRDAGMVAQAIADRTGVPVGLGRTAVAASIVRMPPDRRPR